MRKIFSKKWFKNNIITILVVVVAILFLFPLYFMVMNSFRGSTQLMGDPRHLIITSISWFNYERLFTKYNIPLWFINSLLVSGIATAVVIFTNTMAGYALAKKKFYGNNLIFWLIMGTIMLPRQVLIVPMFILMKDLNLIGKYPSIMLPAIGWPIGIFLMRQFIRTIPNEIIESSIIDGCNEIQTFFKIIIPLAKPGIGALAIFTFVGVWNDYLWQLIIIDRSSLVTLPLGVANIMTGLFPEYSIIFAGSTIAAFPMITIFLIFQRYFTKGITLGAIKG